MEFRYSFQLQEGQLYTPYDLSFKAWEQRGAVQKAISESVTDPFERINIDPYWEYKVRLDLMAF